MSTPELIAPARLEELLGGAVPDTHAEARLQGLALELRAGAPSAGEPLRKRVQALGIAHPRPRIQVSRRRLALIVAPALLALIAGSVILSRGGSSSSPHGEPLRQVPRALEHSPSLNTNLSAQGLLAPPKPTGQYLPPSTRARHVDTWIELRVRNADRVSAAANDAMRITRELGGYVASSTVGTRGDEGRAEISVRLPVGKLDDALFRLSQLGTITSQRVVTEDRQAAIDSSARQIEKLRAAIRIARLRLESGTLDAKGRLQVQIKLERLRRRLGSLESSRARLVRDAATADLTLVLHTQTAASGKAKRSGVAGIAGDALHVLGRVGAIALFAAIVVSPFVVLALLFWLLRRRRMRLQEAQLLDRVGSSAPSPQRPAP